MSLDTLMNLSVALQLSTDYILFGNQATDIVSLSQQLAKMNEKQRERAEKDLFDKNKLFRDENVVDGETTYQYKGIINCQIMKIYKPTLDESVGSN